MDAELRVESSLRPSIHGGGWEILVIFLVLFGIMNGFYQLVRRFGICTALQPCDQAIAEYCQNLAGLDTKAFQLEASEL